MGRLMTHSVSAICAAAAEPFRSHAVFFARNAFLPAAELTTLLYFFSAAGRSMSCRVDQQELRSMVQGGLTSACVQTMVTNFLLPEAFI